ncbi:hypothetical protein EPUS_09496 [Endocarpon pusillum Z07020]|uniref:Rhodopsin domain-containing protein n=1 Tax=Endocarpon pusillum (strain Z07020 / HMAS-L-300199) TaxID=1263415 RepID=U1HQ64_ENDPU|nr:uncharacterized protein EPUS_09496 [Endocarpon pusillum Z07020]ERF71199.1 hypothetical protein EPUS_09496 [Endocarpon pusillum Z07020]
MAWNVANFVTLAVLFAFLSIISIALRFWSRRVNKTKLGIDDALIIPATLCVVGIAVTMIVGTALGEMAQHQKLEIGPGGPIYNNSRATYEKCNYVLQLLSLASLGCSKTSVLFFYRRIFSIHKRFELINTTLIVLIIAWAVSFFFATAFQCKDPVTFWTTFEYPRVNCVDAYSFYYSVSTTGFITDLMILSSPIPIIWQLQMPLKNKLAVACILLLGAVVCGAGIARFVTFINVGRGFIANIHDVTYFTTPVFAWTMIESSLAVVSANLPILRPLLQKQTYTDSYLWSMLRSTLPLMAGYNQQTPKSGSKASLPRKFHHAGKDGSSGYQVSMDGVQMEPVPPLDHNIYMQREYEVA